MKKDLGTKLGILYKKNWVLFFFSIVAAILGIFFFQTHILILCVIGMMLFSIGIYYLFDLLFTRIILCIPSTIITYQEIDELEQEQRKHYFLGHLNFRTYYHFIQKPYNTLFTVSKKEYFDLSFLLDKMNTVSFQK